MKIDKKNERITVRLTPNQYLELEDLSKVLNVGKSKLIRTIIDEFLNKYNN